MTSQLDGKVAIVTGATSGMGWATAIRFAKEGANVIATGRRAGRGADLVEAASGFAGAIHYVQADATNPEDVKASVGENDLLVFPAQRFHQRSQFFPWLDFCLRREAPHVELTLHLEGIHHGSARLADRHPRREVAELSVLPVPSSCGDRQREGG